MTYTVRLRASIPPDLYQIGRAIGRALDPDVGGAETWGPEMQGDPPAVPEYYTTDFPCTPEFKEQVEAMLANQEILFAVVSADYESRWPDMTAPTVQDCKLFCDGVSIFDDSIIPQEII